MSYITLSGIFCLWAEQSCQLISFTEGMLHRVTSVTWTFARRSLDMGALVSSFASGSTWQSSWLPLSFYVMLSLVSGTDEVVDCSLIVGWLGAGAHSGSDAWFILSPGNDASDRESTLTRHSPFVQSVSTTKKFIEGRAIPTVLMGGIVGRRNYLHFTDHRFEKRLLLSWFRWCCLVARSTT